MVSKHHHHHHRHHHSGSQRKSSATAAPAETVGRPVSLIETDQLNIKNNKKSQHPNIRFLLLDCPTNTNLPYYLEEFKRYDVDQVIRCQQPFKDDDSKSRKYNYDITPLIEQGVQIHDLPFRDGGIPPRDIIQKWLSILEAVHQEQQEQQHHGEPMANSAHTIAVHCMAGLGRAPVLVAIALIELFHMEPLDTVEFIRLRRKGAFNSTQICFLDRYKPTLRNNNVFGRNINISSSSSSSSSSSRRNSRDFQNNHGHKLSPTLTYLMNYFSGIFGNNKHSTATDDDDSEEAGKAQRPAASAAAPTTATITTFVN